MSIQKNRRMNIHNSSTFLFVNDAIAASDPEYIRKHSIKAIINCAGDHHPNPFESEIEYLTLKGVHDRANVKLSQHFASTSSFIDKHVSAGSNVLVHCTSGISRSSSIAIAYFMTKNRVNLREAFGELKRVRPEVEPNIGFWMQLIELENELFQPTEPSYHWIDYVWFAYQPVWFPNGAKPDQEKLGRSIIKEYSEKYSNLFELENYLYDHQF